MPDALMSDLLNTITKLIQSPPGQLVAGAALAGIVWKFFERVESVLNDDTKLEIAVWLVGAKTAERVAPWPATFAKVFDHIFGTKRLSWQCLCKSVMASVAVTVLAAALWSMSSRNAYLPLTLDSGIWTVVLAVWAFGLFISYLSLLTTRRFLSDMCSTGNVKRWVYVLAVDLLGTWLLAALSLSVLRTVFRFLRHPAWFRSYVPATYLLKEAALWLVFFRRHPTTVFNCHPFLSLSLSDGRLVKFGLNLSTLAVYPAFFTLTWLWLYAGSGFLLKAARKFDIGFDWFNRKFDIEKKPLQSIGLVAGALVAVVYWAAVIVSRVVG